jgi:Mannosyltransferase (PIG-V)
VRTIPAFTSDRLQALVVVVATRVGYWAAVLVALLWAPIRTGFPVHAAYGRRTDFIFGAFDQWDANWFLRIAQHGYDTKQSASFFPLYPLLTRGLAFVLRSNLVAGVAISLLAAGFAGVAVLRIARRYAGDRVAHDSVLFLALYPISFVFTAVYSDGLFLALAAWAFVFALEGRVTTAAVLGGLAVLTRPTGLALFPALVWLLWPKPLLRLSPLLLLPAALAGYCVYLHSHFGDAFAFVHSEGSFWLRHVPATGPFGGAWDALKSGKEGLAQLVLHLPPGSGAGSGFGKPEQFAIWNVAQLVLLVAACALTWVCWRKVDRAAALYSATTIVLFLSAPAAVVPLVSEPRFLIGDFPLFITLAAVSAGRPRLRTFVVASFAAVGMLAAVGFTHGIWIS